VIDEISDGGAGTVPDFTRPAARKGQGNPTCCYVFVPAGEPLDAVVKDLTRARSACARRIKLIGPGDITERTPQAQARGQCGGRPQHGSLSRRSRQSGKKALRAAWKRNLRPQDRRELLRGRGMTALAAIVHGVQALKGTIDSDQALEA